MDDDHFSSDFQFQLTDDLFQFTYGPLPQQTIFPPSNEVPLIPSYHPEAESLVNNPLCSNMEMAQKSSNDFTEGDHQHSHELINKNREKKVTHKNIEKQRRQEMSALHRSLRSLLPIEYVKGRRSICDHIHESSNYIKCLKNNIKDLSDKRDQLKRLKNLHSLEGTIDQESFPQRGHLEKVRVTPSWPGIEISAETDLRQGISFWRVVQTLVEEGLSVVSCVSTKVNERFLHTIKAEVSQGRTKDLFKLQQKLAKLWI